MDESKFAAGRVVTGFSSTYVARYDANGGVPKYTDGLKLARSVSISPDITTQGDDNNFFADNVLAETAPRRFRSGNLTFTVDGLLRSAENLIMGLAATSSITVGEASVTMNDYDDTQKIPYVGIGSVVRCMSNGIEFFVAHIYTKARFAQFAVGATTEGDDGIDWQTQELTASVMRDDSTTHRWQRVSEPLATEMEAENAVRVALGMEPLPAVTEAVG